MNADEWREKFIKPLGVRLAAQCRDVDEVKAKRDAFMADIVAELEQQAAGEPIRQEARRLRDAARQHRKRFYHAVVARHARRIIAERSDP